MTRPLTRDHVEKVPDRSVSSWDLVEYRFLEAKRAKDAGDHDAHRFEFDEFFREAELYRTTVQHYPNGNVGVARRQLIAVERRTQRSSA